VDELLNHAPCGFLSFADDGTVRAANATLLDLLGYAPEELVGRHVESILGAAGRIFSQTHLFPLVRLHGRADEIHILLRTGSGVDVPVLVSAVREVDGDTPLNHCSLMTMSQLKHF